MIKRYVVCDKCGNEIQYGDKFAENVVIECTEYGIMGAFIGQGTQHKRLLKGDLCYKCYKELQRQLSHFFTTGDKWNERGV